MRSWLHRLAVGFLGFGMSWCAAAASTPVPDVSGVYGRAVLAAVQRPDKAFWYSFAAPEKEGLAFVPGPQKGELERLAGPWKGRSAVHLFHGGLGGEPFAFTPDATVVFWLRVHGWEKVDRAGYKRTNGGVMAVGSGWYGGWRIVVTPASGTVSFTLGGHPEDTKAPRVSLSASGCLTLERWHHLAICRAGPLLRLYVDGTLQAERDVADPYMPPSKVSDRLRVGECNFGVGVLDFDISDLGFFRAALPEPLLRRLGNPAIELAGELGGNLGAAARLPRTGQPADEEKLRAAYRALQAMPGDEAETRYAVSNVKAVASLEIAASWRREKRPDEARREYARLAADKTTPEHYRTRARFAAAEVLRDERQYAAGAREYKALRDAFTGKHEHYRLEAIERLEDVRGLRDGEPFRSARHRRVDRILRPVPRFWVATDGADANPGTRVKPFRSLERARAAVRALKAAGPLPAGGIAVVLRGGVYRRSAGFKLGPEDSGTAAAPVAYVAAPSERVILRGGRAIDGFTPLADTRGKKRIPAAAQPHVLEADLRAAGVADLGTFYSRGYGRNPDKPAHLEVFFRHLPMPLARWPNPTPKLSKRFTTVKGLIGEHLGKFVNKTIDKTNGFIYSGLRPENWLGEPEIWLFGYWGRMYAATWIQVQAIDPEKHQVRIVPPLPPYAFIAGAPYFAANLLCELDAPGEWYVDKPRGILFFWPPEPPRPGDVVVSELEEPMLQCDGVSHVIFRGLVLEAGRFHGAVVTGGEDVVLAKCVLRDFGVSGVRLEGGRDHVLVGCDIEYPGAGGVAMRGGKPKTLEPSGFLVENCHIHHFDRWNRAGYQAGVIQQGVGTRISHCLIHDGPHQAVRVQENDHVLEYTEIHDTCHEAGEMGSYYMYGGRRVLGERGQVVRFNYWHDLPWNETYKSFAYTGRHALHIDHMNGDITLYGNIFQRCFTKSGVFFSGGPDNTVENNVFYRCSRAINLNDRSWVYKKVNRPPRYVLDAYLRQMHVDQPPWSGRYPQLREYPAKAENLEVFLTGNVVSRNLAVRCGQFLVGSQKVRRLSRIEHNWVDGDPGFRAAGKGDFTLSPGSPVVVSCGFEPLPVERIGLYNDPLRATWPVRHPAGNHENILTAKSLVEKKHPVYRVARISTPVAIDGVLAPAEWGGLKQADAMVLARDPSDRPAKSLPSYAWIRRDRDYLYVGIRNEVNPGVPPRTGESFWSRDMAEIIIEGKPGIGTGGWWQDEKPYGPLAYLVGDFAGNFDAIAVADLPASRARRLRAAVEYAAKVVAPGLWTCEWKIPVALLCLDPGKTAECNANIGVHKPGGNPTLPAGTKLTGNDQWAVWSGCHGPNWEVWNAGRLRLLEK